MPKLIFLLVGALLAASASGRATAQTQSSAPVAGDTTSASVDLHIREGLAAAARSDWPAAIERFMQAHLLAPDNPVPLYNLGLAHMTTGHSSAAIAWWEAYLAAAPQADNAGRVRAEIGRLDDHAVATVRGYVGAARSNLGQLSGPEREQQQRTVASGEETISPLFAAVVTDSVRFRLAGALNSTVGEHSASLAMVRQIADSALHDERLAEFAAYHASDPATARRYASAIFDATRRAAALATIDEQERAIRLDTVFYERLRRGEYPADQVAAYLARGGSFAPGQWEFRNLVSRLARHGFHDYAERLASQVTTFPERETLLHLLAAEKLRAGDFDGALKHAREILAEARTPRSEVMLAAEAVRRIASGDVERGLRTLRERVTDVRIQWHALATVASNAKERGDAALTERATQLQRALPAATSNASINVLALAIAEDYETALAMASINNPSEMWGWFDGGYETGGSVQDFLDRGSALEADYAKVAFVAALR
ncbi:MAG TPA: tetratricopeptide repeat protein, partial [Opitutaceae bacterium]|nr:tetratricopeptide repeat protein [Opitutaceae bacterium]